MIVLGFDTATSATAIGLRLADGGIVQARDDPRRGERPGHATRLLPLAARLLREAGLSFGDLDRIAVGLGPGTFTGLRIGVASARGLAQSLETELVGVSSLRALAQAVVKEEAGRGSGGRGSAGKSSAERSSAGGSSDLRQGVLAVIDARRGEAFAAAFASGDGSAVDRERIVPRELVSPRALAPARLGGLLEDMNAGESPPRWVAVGDGAVLYRHELEALGARVPQDDSPLHMVSGRAICEMAVSADAQTLDAVLPDYRRRPDAEIALERAAAPATAEPVHAAPGGTRA
jgi:tRNA threonylcarbamoyladenosine biosynthesis protein TsaB